MNPTETRCLGSFCRQGVILFESQVMQDVADDEADADRGSESAAGAQSPSNAAGGSKVESDEAGAQSPSNVAGGSEVKCDEAGAQSDGAGTQSDGAGAQSPSNVAEPDGLMVCASAV